MVLDRCWLGPLPEQSHTLTGQNHIYFSALPRFTPDRWIEAKGIREPTAVHALEQRRVLGRRCRSGPLTKL